MPRKKKEQTEEIKKPKAIGPFDIIKMMFTDTAAFDNLPKSVLEKNFFMINRVMSIQFPLQAECFNHLSINQASVIKAWRQFAISKLGYGKMPSFIFTKTVKAEQAELQIDDISKELKENYCKHFNISLKDFNDMMEMFHDMTVKHVKNFESIINNANSIDKIK
ncbi:MAG: hypothetical protein [Wendovervirus sonii]|uniref:Uncharacterized protein n=1 Tax=phage Lak_Megaphage_Sonny TaxID=3109229 RepID=A0ABZ0Z556_9CAUD|nr:MAG: hypothetical protein [phage Lak_Megaphage_Sonny]